MLNDMVALPSIAYFPVVHLDRYGQQPFKRSF